MQDNTVSINAKDSKISNNGFQQWSSEPASAAQANSYGENYESQGQDLRQGPRQGQEAASTGSDGEYQVASHMGQNHPHNAFL